VLAGCNTTGKLQILKNYNSHLILVSLETAKYLLDSGQCSINDLEPDMNLTPLHIAASWDNLMMCQLFVHYGADLLAMNRDNYTPSDLAKGSSRLFLQGLMKRGQKKRNRKIFKFLRSVFACFNF
jgi:ankyrin repeat protein